MYTKLKSLGLGLILSLGSLSSYAAPLIQHVHATQGLNSVPVHIGGRTQGVEGDAASHAFQWPGIYFETNFKGEAIFFKINQGDSHYQLLVDDLPAIDLQRPKPGTYRLNGLDQGIHHVRLEVVSENQITQSQFGGFFLQNPADAVAGTVYERQIEFIGDSHTVGYGNTSTKHECNNDEVNDTTNTSLAFGPLVAKYFKADYQINAMSGHGIVRNYNGFAGASVPEAYPYRLLTPSQPYEDSTWKPQLIVIGLGTNDFSTPLNAGEKWATREALQKDYEQTYIAFVKSLRIKHPNAFFILATQDQDGGELNGEVKKVFDALKADGETRIAFVQYPPLGFESCHWHPSTKDDQLIANTLMQFIEAHDEIWH